MKDCEVIEALGGHIAVAKEIGVSAETMLHCANGRAIPWGHRPKIKALAKRRRVRLPPDFLWARRGS